MAGSVLSLGWGAIALAVLVGSACRRGPERRESLPAPSPALDAASPPPAPNAAHQATPEVPRAASGPELQRRLAAKSPFEGEPEAGLTVSPESRALLREVKDALLAVTDGALSRIATAQDPDAALRQAFLDAGYDWADQDDWEEGALDGTFSRVPEHPQRCMVELCLLLAPGSDCQLVVYERAAESWRRRLQVRSDDYASIEGAIHNLHWELSSPAPDGSFYLVEAHTFPWMASRWRDFTYRALAPTSDPAAPKVLASGTAGGNWENGYRIRATQTGFSIAFDVWSDDPPDFQRMALHDWSRQGERFVQTKAER